MPWPVVAAGALALAGLLFLLQRLRARPHVVRLANAMLWAAVASDAPRRVLLGRFSRWLAYLLVLAIALLLWLAAAQPEPAAASDGRLHLFYLDASAPMMAGDRFADARRALVADAAAIPSDDRAVTLGAAFPAGLLDRGEDGALLQGRLARSAPVAAPSAFADWLKGGVARDDAQAVTVHYYGADRIGAERLPAGVRVVVGYGAPPVAGNRGIVALGALPARSGGGGADVLVRAIDAQGRGIAADALRIALDGRRITPTMQATAPGTWRIADLDATGGTLAVSLARSDGFAADDRAAIVLPDLRPVRVAIAPDVPAAIRAVAAIDPAVRLVAADAAQVVVRRAGAAFGGDRPALEVRDATGGAAAFAITDPDGADRATLVRDLDASGVTQIDAARLAEGSGRPVAATIADGPRRGIAVWTQLFAADGAFATSREMPLFVARSLRWLAHPPAIIPYAEAGVPIRDQSALYGLGPDAALADAALAGDVVAGQVGARTIGGRPVMVSLDSPAITRAVAAPAEASGAPAWRRRADLIVPALLVAAGMLLAIEWLLLTRRRIP